MLLKNTLVWVLAGFAVLMGGCLDETREITFNADGSGKMVYQTTFDSSGSGFFGSDQEDKTDADIVSGIIESSEGVDVWEDVSLSTLDDGKKAFKGTAYFRNFSNVKMVINGASIDIEKIIQSKGDNGEFVVVFDKTDKGQDEGFEPVEYTDEQLAEEVEKVQKKYGEQSMQFAMVMKDMRNEMTVHLPGKIDSVNNFTKVDDDTVHLLYEGSKLMAAMTTAYQDDEWVGKMLRDGRDLVEDGPGNMEYVFELMYGAKGPVKAVVNNPIDNFDYKKAVAAAGEKYPEMLKTLGVGMSADVSPETVEGLAKLQDVEVVGVQWSFVKDPEWNMKPFNSEGYKLALYGRFEEPVGDVTGGKVFSAVTDTGQVVTPVSFRRKINNASLSEDKKTVEFEINMKSPGEDATYIKKAEGILEVVTTGGYEDVDLGVISLETGVKADKLGVEVGEIKENKWEEGKWVLDLTIALNKSAIKSVKFYDVDGVEIKTSNYGMQYWDDKCKKNIKFDDKVPGKARVVINAATRVEKQNVAFEINDVSLCGR